MVWVPRYSGSRSGPTRTLLTYDLRLDSVRQRTQEVSHLRSLLEHHGLLPHRDEYLARFEIWLGAKLDAIAGPAVRAPVEQFATWHHLGRLRGNSTRGQASRKIDAIGQTTSDRNDQIPYLATRHPPSNRTYRYRLPEAMRLDTPSWWHPSVLQRQYRCGGFEVSVVVDDGEPVWAARRRSRALRRPAMPLWPTAAPSIRGPQAPRHLRRRLPAAAMMSIGKARSAIPCEIPGTTLLSATIDRRPSQLAKLLRGAEPTRPKGDSELVEEHGPNVAYLQELSRDSR